MDLVVWCLFFTFEFSFVIIIESGHFKYFKIFKSFLEPIGVITRYLIALFELFQVNFEWSHDFWQIFAISTPISSFITEIRVISKCKKEYLPYRKVGGEFVFLIWYKNKVRVTLNLCENAPEKRQNTPEDKHFNDSVILEAQYRLTPLLQRAAQNCDC